MTSIRIAELKDHLSENLRKVQAGESLVVLDRTTPIAHIVPVPLLASGADLRVVAPKQTWRQVAAHDLPVAPLRATDSLHVLAIERGDGR